MERHLFTGVLAATSASLACPHCQAGAEQAVVGLCWDQDEASWRCLLCGYRVFDRPRRSEAQIAADRFWEQMFPSVEDEDGRRQEEREPDEQFGALHPQAAHVSPQAGSRPGMVGAVESSRL
jgi:DNA-directed RNA polymerase subunit RPC12/RpoP